MNQGNQTPSAQDAVEKQVAEVMALVGKYGTAVHDNSTGNPSNYTLASAENAAFNAVRIHVRALLSGKCLLQIKEPASTISPRSIPPEQFYAEKRREPVVPDDLEKARALILELEESRTQELRAYELTVSNLREQVEQGKCLHQIAEPAGYPEINYALFSGNGDLWTLIYAWSDDDCEAAGRNVDEHIHSMMRAYVDADRAQRAAPPQAVQPAVPVIFVSREQLESHTDHLASEAGRYLPARKTAVGKFTMPLYAHPAEEVPAATVVNMPADPTEEMLEVLMAGEDRLRARHGDELPKERAKERYQALLALAATQPAAQGSGES